MQITFEAANKNEDIDFILHCIMAQPNGVMPPTRRWILDKIPALRTTCEKYKDYDLQKMALRQQLSHMYDKHIEDINHAVNVHNKIFISENVSKISNAFDQAFNTDCDKILKSGVIGQIGINPICPRDLRAHIFCIPFYYDPTYTPQTLIHETIHFIWFHIWHELFHDQWSEYEAPSLKWLLSELVVDPIAKYSELVNCYKNNPGNPIAYNYFYNVQINNFPILQTLGHMYNNRTSINDFIKQAWQYCTQHEHEILSRIESAQQHQPQQNKKETR